MVVLKRETDVDDYVIPAGHHNSRMDKMYAVWKHLLSSIEAETYLSDLLRLLHDQFDQSIDLSLIDSMWVQTTVLIF